MERIITHIDSWGPRSPVSAARRGRPSRERIRDIRRASFDTLARRPMRLLPALTDRSRRVICSRNAIALRAKSLQTTWSARTRLRRGTCRHQRTVRSNVTPKAPAVWSDRSRHYCRHKRLCVADLSCGCSDHAKVFLFLSFSRGDTFTSKEKGFTRFAPW